MVSVDLRILKNNYEGKGQESRCSGYGTLALVFRIIAWLLIVWAVSILRGLLVDPLRSVPGLGAAIPQKKSWITTWVVGTLFAIVIILVCIAIGKFFA